LRLWSFDLNVSDFYTTLLVVIALTVLILVYFHKQGNQGDYKPMKQTEQTIKP